MYFLEKITCVNCFNAVNCIPKISFVITRYSSNDLIPKMRQDTLRDPMLTHLIESRSKKTSKLRVIGLCGGNFPATGEFRTKRAGNAENVSIGWRHHAIPILWCEFKISSKKTSFRELLCGGAISRNFKGILTDSFEISWKRGAVSIRKTVLPGMAIPMLKIRRPNGRLIFNMGIPIPGKDGLYIETGPGWLDIWGIFY